ncbi:MAG: COG4223 family protein [Parvularculaceae bacterium]
MVADDSQLPQKAEPDPPEIAAEPDGTALTTQEAPPAASPEPAGRSPGLILLAIFAAVLAIASAAYFSRARAPTPPVPGSAADAPAAARLEIPQEKPAAGAGLHDAPGPVNPSPDKIFNDGASAKNALGAAPDSSGAGFINDLPPAPHAAPGANDVLRDAAKNALRNKADEAPSTEQSEPEASLDPFSERALTAERAAARRALAFAALAAKARSGAPYAEELRMFLAEPQDEPLPALVADRAGEGVPTAAMLAASFPEFHRGALAAGRRAEAKGAAAGLGSSFASLVNLRPAKPLQGASSVAVLSRVEAAALAGDLSRALAEAAALRPEAADALKPWLEDARARLALDEALAARERAMLALLAPGRL